MMEVPVLEILELSQSATLQDEGRAGLARWGVPPSGPMDTHAMWWANRLVGNPENAAVVECPPQRIRARVLQPARISLTGADLGWNVPRWRSVDLKPGDVLMTSSNPSGVWSYLAVQGGFRSQPILGSVSGAPALKLGHSLKVGMRLCTTTQPVSTTPSSIASAIAPLAEQRDYRCPPSIQVWPGPQWDEIPGESRDAFFKEPWVVDIQSSRSGMRLQGCRLESIQRELLSEPVRVGTIQLPSGGSPIVSFVDGPTVGGYPKLGWIPRASLSWLAQCRPGQQVHFVRA